MCRQPLKQADYPNCVDVVAEKANLELLPHSSGYITIRSVHSGSPAERAGLRTNQPVAAINHVNLKSARHGDALLRAAAGPTVLVTIKILHNPLPPGIVIPVGEPPLPLMSDDMPINAVACFCYCNVLGQLAQRVLCQRHPSCCVLVAILFWALALTVFAPDMIKAAGLDGSTPGVWPFVDDPVEFTEIDVVAAGGAILSAAGGCVLVRHVRRRLLVGAPPSDPEWRYGSIASLTLCCTAARLLSRVGARGGNYRLCALLRAESAVVGMETQYEPTRDVEAPASS